MSSVKEIFENITGCTGGILVFDMVRAMLEGLNRSKARKTLSGKVRDQMKLWFPKLDFTKVKYVNKTNWWSLVSNRWFNSNAKAITIGKTIYFKGKFRSGNESDVNLLMHELVHVNQCRIYGGTSKFACEYGMGYADAGYSYRRNHLEKEARDFVTKCWCWPFPCLGKCLGTGGAGAEEEENWLWQWVLLEST